MNLGLIVLVLVFSHGDKVQLFSVGYLHCILLKKVSCTNDGIMEFHGLNE